MINAEGMGGTCNIIVVYWVMHAAGDLWHLFNSAKLFREDLYIYVVFWSNILHL